MKETRKIRNLAKASLEVKVDYLLRKGNNGVLTVSGDIVDNSDPKNPIINNPTPVDIRPYKVYTALLTQSGTTAPVATVLENTLGITPTWTYANVGQYIINNFFNEINNNKIAIFFNGATNNQPPDVCTYQASVFRNTSVNTVVLYTYKDGAYSNGLLDIGNNYSSIEIRVYN